MTRFKTIAARAALAAASLLSATVCPAAEPPRPSWERLPFETVFKGAAKFETLKRKAAAENWAALPIGERTAAVGRALLGTPYKSFTLEIDDRVEAPSVNLEGLDCWTFFEVALAFARMLGDPPAQHTPQRLLHYIELDRYRGGVCTGEYLSRLHYLADWLKDNVKRGLVQDVGRALPGAARHYNTCCEMSNGWRHYRYLAANPKLLGPMREHEARITKLEVWHVPKARVAAIEPQLQNGDIIGITTRYKGAFCSHVGLAQRDAAGVLRFMHASSQKGQREVTLDSRLSTYLARFSGHAGILVARPLK